MSKAAKRAAKLHLLTAREVLNAADGDHADGGGLCLRVRGAGSSWVLRFTAPSGRRREMGLGIAHRDSAKDAGKSLTDARDEAHEARELLRQGVDPIEARDGCKATARQAEADRKSERAREHWTLSRAARDYHARVIEPTKTTKHAAQWIASLENHIPAALWNKPVGDVKAPELLQALLAIKPHERARNLSQGERVQETVQRIRQRLDAIYEDAIFHERAASNPAAAIKRKLRESSGRQERGEFRALPYKEAPAFMAALRQAAGIAARCLEFTVLTAARTSETLGAKWTEFDLDAGVWQVPAVRMKAGETHAVFLSPRAVEILKGMQHVDERYVFPSTIKTGDDGRAKQMSNMAMLVVLDRLGYRDRTTVHGLARATFSTWANETGAARPDVIEACLAHEEGNRVRAAYNRAKFNDERRALLARWAEYLSTPAAQVLPFKAA